MPSFDIITLDKEDDLQSGSEIFARNPFVADETKTVKAIKVQKMTETLFENYKATFEGKSLKERRDAC
jgi:hypothetical protein